MAEYKEYIDYAVANGYSIVCIMRDLEDREIYPLYFKIEAELDLHKSRIISESKVKILKIIYI
jgi:hypothetical protein